jgi:hypothetical protein
MKPLLAVSFHTPDATYSQAANYLRSGLERCGLPHRLLLRKPIGNWARNNHIKPQVIQQFHAEGTHDILWIDADSIVWEDPTPHIAALGACDFAAAWHESTKGPHLFASTLLFRQTDPARALLEAWISTCEHRAKSITSEFDWKQSDQLHLQHCVEAARRAGLVDRVMNPALAFVHNTDRRRYGTEIRPVIEAFQLSRVLRHEKGANLEVARVADAG